MAQRTLSSDPNVLLSLMDDIDESESEDEFEGWLADDDGPTILRHSVVSDYEKSSAPSAARSRSLESLNTEPLQHSPPGSPSSPMQVDTSSPSLSPMQSPSTSAPPTLDDTTASSATSTTTTSRALHFTATPGIIPNMEGRDPIDFFRLMFDDRILDLIFTETTRYAEQYLEREREHLESHPNARAHDIRKNRLTCKEVEAFLSLLIAMGMCGFPTLR